MEDITGIKYGYLTALKFIKRDKTHYSWLFKCDCGNEKIMDRIHVKSGHSKSCGCMVSKLCKKANTTHGNTSDGKMSPEFRVWIAMRQRCYYKKNIHYHNYGGRGIKVCDRWKDSFQNFLEDMGQKPERMTLERINNDGNYELLNYRWATYQEQANNRSNNNIIEYNGEKDTMSNWCRKFGITVSLFGNRKRIGWNLEEIFTTPKRKLCRKSS